MYKHLFLLFLSVVFCVVMVVYIFSPVRKHTECFESEDIVCPMSTESFQNKKFLKKGNCYDHEATSCQSVLTHMGVTPNVDGLTSDQIDIAVSLMSANTYEDASGDSYNTNECIISKSDAQELKMGDCRIGTLNMKQTNPNDSDVTWAHREGCIIDETILRNNLGDVVKHIHTKFREVPIEMQKNLNARIADNRRATQDHWSRFRSNGIATQTARGQEADAKRRDRDNKLNTQSHINQENASKANTPIFQGIADHNDHVNAGMRRDCSGYWTGWSHCQGSCGTGTQVNTYVVIHDGANGGTVCPTVRRQEKSCTLEPCIPPEIHVPINFSTGAIRSAEDQRYCVDVDGRNGRDFRADLATVINYPCRAPPTEAQLLFRGHHNSLQFNPSKKCMDVYNWGGHGANVIQYACHHNGNQQWTYHTDQSLRPGHNKQLCLTRYGEGMRVMRCNGQGNQKWVFRT